MFDIHCPHCETRQLLSTTSIVSTHRTDSGPVAYVHCVHGHPLVKHFRSGETSTIESWSELHLIAS